MTRFTTLRDVLMTVLALGVVTASLILWGETSPAWLRYLGVGVFAAGMVVLVEYVSALIHVWGKR